MYQHRNEIILGFTSKYHVHLLVYYEVADTMESAIQREKQLKKWNRDWKIRLIEKENPQWLDLSSNLL